MNWNIDRAVEKTEDLGVPRAEGDEHLDNSIKA
jgi:hypothetical protein